MVHCPEQAQTEIKHAARAWITESIRVAATGSTPRRPRVETFEWQPEVPVRSEPAMNDGGTLLSLKRSIDRHFRRVYALRLRPRWQWIFKLL
jgi:hypothetical protein